MGLCAGWVNEQIGGVEYLHYIRDLAKRVESDWDSIHADLREIQKLVLSVEVHHPFLSCTAQDYTYWQSMTVDLHACPKRIPWNTHADVLAIRIMKRVVVCRAHT